MEALLLRKASLFEISSYIATCNDSQRSLLETILKHDHLKDQLIIAMYENGMDLEIMEELGVDMKPIQFREYVTLKECLQHCDITEEFVSDQLVFDGFRTETIKYFTFEYALIRTSGYHLDIFLSYLDENEDLTRILPLIGLMEELPDCLVFYLKRRGIDLSKFALSEEQLNFPERKQIPSNEDVITAYNEETCFDMYSLNERTQEGLSVLFVLVDYASKNHPEKVSDILAELCCSNREQVFTNCCEQFVELNREAIREGKYQETLKAFASYDINCEEILNPRPTVCVIL